MMNELESLGRFGQSTHHFNPKPCGEVFFLDSHTITTT
jgi:hypothetical protein